MKITATKLRQNLYTYLDKVIESGITIEITRKGKIIKINTEEKKSKFDNLKPHKIMSSDPADLIDINWTNEWNQGKNL
jgi:antitoxin (DNA-binding transcriptional repressor) of toxin-antitoxin stability system